MSQQEFPEGWVEVVIDKVAKVVSGGTPKAGSPDNFEQPGNGIPWLTPADLSGYQSKTISRGARDLSDVGYASCSAKLMPAGSIVFSSRAPIGYVAISENEICTNQGFKSFIFYGGVNSSYAYYYLKSIRAHAESLGTGTTFKEVSGSNIKKLPFPLIPLVEQELIADKLDTLLAQVNNLKARLDAIPAILKRFRQSVLAAAVSGKLTEEWRQNLHFRDWSYSPLESFYLKIQIGPFGSLLHKSDYIEGGIPLVNPMHISEGVISASHGISISEDKAKELERYRLQAGDVVLGRRGEMGRAAVVRDDNTPLICGTGSLFLRPNTNKISSKFLSLYIRSPQVVQALSAASVGSTMVNLNQKTLKKIQYPDVEIEEQKEIVRRVDQLFAFADQVEVQVENAQSRVNNLTQSILAKAFRGELTAQWRAENPELISGENSASALLERIKAEKEKTKPVKKQRGRKPATDTTS